MKLFLRFMVWATELELAVARKGGNRKLVADLSADLMKWQGELLRWEVRHAT